MKTVTANLLAAGGRSQVLNLGWQLTVDIDELSKLFMINGRPDLPSTFQPANISEIAVGLPIIFNTLAVRCTIIPAENGHCSQYYAALAAGGIVPEPHSSSQPPLGSHLHIPKFPPLKPHKKCRRSKQAKTQSADKVSSNKNPNDKNTKVGSRSSKTDTAIENGQHSTTGVGSNSCNVKYSDNVGRIFKNPRIHGAFLGVGDYGNLALPNGKFGLGFRRFSLADYSFTALGHSGIGGSMGFCDIRHDFAIAVTVNKMSLGGCDKKYNSIGLFRAECAIAR